jgi:hypothetical protein
MVAASLLKSFGKTGPEAIEYVRLSRSPRAVESADQEEFVHDFKPLVDS